jgi:hypothetical protein
VNILKFSKVDNVLKKIFYEPLFHFLVLGGLLFLFYAFVEESEENENNILISQERIEELTSALEKKNLSLLTAEEKEKMINQEVYETVLYKEALKIGLDKNDADMKRHLADRMAFVIYDTYEVPLPSDETLKKFMLENSDDYREEEKIHFIQNMMGVDSIGFEKEYTLTSFEVGNIFGRAFSEVLFNLKADAKIEKIESDYGVHEVKILDKPIGKLQAFEKIKEKLTNDYLNAKREEKNKVIYEALKSQYSISIEE